MVIQKIHEAINRLNLDLSGKTVLTEAATGAYVVTPLIAAMAGARVFAYTRDTRYGTVEDVRRQTLELYHETGRSSEGLQVIDTLTPEIIASADIITNSGHLRPLDEKKLKFAKKGAVIPLMYEAWEWRDADLNLDFCKKNGLISGATNERHPDVDVFNYLGDMAIKLILDAGLSFQNNRFVLISNNDFGPFIAKKLSAITTLAVCDLESRKHEYSGMPVTWAGNFPEIEIPENFKNAEAVIFTAYPFVDTWIGEDSVITNAKLLSQLNNPYILRYAGEIDTKSCTESRIRYFPQEVKPGHMGVLPSAIGFDPIIRLQSGGLKAAELMLKGQTDYNGIRLADML